MGFDKAKVLRAAEKHLTQGKIPAAIQEYRRIVEADPEDYTALNTLGDLYARVEQRAEAVACYQRVAEHYRGQGFALKAIAMYKKLSRFTPEDTTLALTLASLYEQQGLIIEARAQYLSAADAQTRAGNRRGALEVLSRLADLDPHNIDIRLRLATGYAQERLLEPAADAYIAAADQLARRGKHEQALEAYTSALSHRPGAHAALHGLVAVHTALGTADEAAEVIEASVNVNPGDLELRAMLARAYVEAENATQAERATEDLVAREPSNFPLYFDVGRVYLQQGDLARATHLLGRAVEHVLARRQDETLGELTALLQEVLTRDPEQMEALHLLVRVYGWQRDDERLRTALERLADAAEAAGDAEEERRALAHLVRLAPEEARYAARLEMLGGALPGEEDAARPPVNGAGEVPTFESFMLYDEAAHAHAASGADAPGPSVSDFEWSAHEPAPAVSAPDASASFADLNDFTDASGAARGFAVTPPSEPDALHEFQEIDFGAHAGGADASRPSGDRTRVEQVLAQELESVDFYLDQGYADIARDTLDMLERQYGSHPQIEARRQLLPPESASPHVAGAAEAAPAPESFEFADFSDIGFIAEAERSAPASADETAAAFFIEAPVEESAPAHDTPSPQTAATPPEPPRVVAPASSTPPAAAGLDPGLAAIFDEFREAVEDPEESTGADYETHYHTGIAYREMGLLDQAIEELQTAIDLTAPGDGTPRYLQCCNLLGHCFMEKGMPRPAAMWFRKGLSAPGHTEDEYQALRFDLGTAYEQMGDLERAIEVLSEVYGIDVSYRGVAERLRELQAQKQ